MNRLALRASLCATLAVLCITTGSQTLPSNHALIVTVSNYAPPNNPLPGVAVDRATATDMARRMGVPEANISFLNNEQVTGTSLRAAIDELGRRVMPGDRVFVYFSGHGGRSFSQQRNECVESLVMHDGRWTTSDTVAQWLKPISARASKSILMLDSCHSGGVAGVTATGLRPGVPGARSLDEPEVLTARTTAAAVSEECRQISNLRTRGLGDSRGRDFDTADGNLVVIAAARKDEVAWEASGGGAMTTYFNACLRGEARDLDRSGSVSIDEITDCVQQRIDRAQKPEVRQHVTVTGNARVVPSFDFRPAPPTVSVAPVTSAGSAPAAAPAAPLVAAAPPAGPVNLAAALADVHAQRDDTWGVSVAQGQQALKIGRDRLDLRITSQRDGYLYLFYAGSSGKSFYLLYPNLLDKDNAVKAGQEIRLPRPNWEITANGPAGTNRLLAMVTQNPRDFTSLQLPQNIVGGVFTAIPPAPDTVGSAARLATLSARATATECQASGGTRDLGIAQRCTSRFGSALFNVVETP